MGGLILNILALMTSLSKVSDTLRLFLEQFVKREKYNEKLVLLNFIKRKKFLTIILKNDIFSSNRFHFLFFIDIFKDEWLFLLDSMISHDVLGKFWNAEWIKSPVDWMPALKGRVRGN